MELPLAAEDPWKYPSEFACASSSLNPTGMRWSWDVRQFQVATTADFQDGIIPQGPIFEQALEIQQEMWLWRGTPWLESAWRNSHIPGKAGKAWSNSHIPGKTTWRNPHIPGTAGKAWSNSHIPGKATWRNSHIPGRAGKAWRNSHIPGTACAGVFHTQITPWNESPEIPSGSSEILWNPPLMDLLSEPPKGRSQTLQPLVQILNLQQNSFAQNLGGLKEYFSPTGLFKVLFLFVLPLWIILTQTQLEAYGRRKIKKLQQENELWVWFARLGDFPGRFQSINLFLALHKSRSRGFF